MSRHITPLPRAGRTGPEAAAEPARRASRFDERGIALQTIIIMVVLLAIAGSVAAVILTRAGEETERLEQTDSAAYGITNETACEIGGHNWQNSDPGTDDHAALERAGVIVPAGAFDWCKPKS